MKQFTLEKTSPYQYITMAHDDSPHTEIIQRCTVENLQKALTDNGITNAKVVWADIRNGKSLNMEHPLLKNFFALPLHSELMEELPDFCDVLIEETTPGGHVANVSVWAPLNWNERFLGCGGGGLQTVIDVRMFEATRTNTIVCAVRNGFASACTDGGNKDKRMMNWGLDEATGELDMEMIQNWSHRSLHSMTVIGKTITEALYGQAPKYSYYQGASTGGRMGLTEAMLYPEDYDGIWSDAPATNHTRFQMSGCWPMYVMNWNNNYIYEAKLNAFQNAIMEQYTCKDGYIDSTDPVPFDPYSMVGHETEDGPITETDAFVIKEIFRGPHTQTGERLFYGIWPGANLCDPSGMGLGLVSYIETEDGSKEPGGFLIPESYVGNWVVQDADWDWKTMTRDQYDRLFQYSQKKFKDIIAGDTSDLSAFRDKGGKLLLSHCAADTLVFPGGTIDLYHRITETMGGEDKTLPFLRFFLTPGGSHCFHAFLGITLADGMIALMNWVEKGIEPETTAIEAYDITSLPAKMILHKEASLYKLSEHPNNDYAIPPVRDMPAESAERSDDALIAELKAASAKAHADNKADKLIGKRLSSSPLFGYGS